MMLEEFDMNIFDLEAYLDGHTAYFEGKPYMNNPFPGGTLYDAWADGWYEASQEDALDALFDKELF